MRWWRRTVRTLMVLAALWLLAWAAERMLDLAAPFSLQALDDFGESRRIVARDGTLLRVVPTRRSERLIRLGREQVSPHLVAAVLAGEDRRFLAHSGVDVWACARAAAQDLFAGRILSGASTLTMQLARILEPMPRTFLGKLRQCLRARQLERSWSKQEILTAYLNLVPIGSNLRGFEAASRFWLGKSARQLAPDEAALLVAMLPAPTRRRPGHGSELLRQARNRVIDRMQEAGFLAAARATQARSAPILARRHPWPFLAPHLCQEALAHHSVAGPVLCLSIDPGLQARAEQVIRGAADTGVDGACAVILERGRGTILALVGSPDWQRCKLDLARCRRSVGSTLKPFLYTLCLEQGVISRDGLVSDRALSFPDYHPQNFTRDHLGAMQPGAALARSRNLPAIDLLRRVGAQAFRTCLAQAGLPTGSAPLHLDAALGTLEVSPLELAQAYERFFRNAEQSPHSARGRVLHMLSKQPPPGAPPVPFPYVWKTGTSSNRRDAWCVALAPRHVLVVWLGDLRGHPVPNLVGQSSAAPLAAHLLACL